MTKNRAQFILGLLIAIMPGLGFPHSWTYTFMIFMGLGVSGISLWNYLEHRPVETKKPETFQESKVISKQ